MSISTEILILLLPILAASIAVNLKLHTLLRDEEIKRRMYENSYWSAVHKKYREDVRFINVENAGDNDTLNRQTQQMLADGYCYRKDMSTDKILAFVKHEEIKEE